MKNIQTNGAARAAKTTTIQTNGTASLLPVVQRKRGEDALAFELRRRHARRDANSERYFARAIPVTIKLSAADYGLLSGGAAHHGTSVEDLVETLVNTNVCELAFDGFFSYLED